MNPLFHTYETTLQVIMPLQTLFLENLPCISHKTTREEPLLKEAYKTTREESLLIKLCISTREEPLLKEAYKTTREESLLIKLCISTREEPLLINLHECKES
jgi:hypothetical protein